MKFAKLQSIANLINGFAFKSSNYTNSGIRVIRISNVQNGFISDDFPCFYPLSFKEEIGEANLKENDLLISLTGNVGRVGIMSKKYLPAGLNQRVGCIRPNKNISTKYLYYFFRSDKFIDDCNKNATGTAQKNLSTVWLSNYMIPIQDNNYLEEKIIKEFDCIYQTIDICTKELRCLDELIKSRFIEMLGDPDENPYNWAVLSIDDVCSSIIRGPFGSSLKKEFFVPKSESTVKVYEQQHAINKNANLGTYYVTQEKYNSLKRFECKPGDILMSCSGTMGELYQLPLECEKGIINQALCKFTLNDKIRPIVFLESMKYVVEQMDKKGSGIKNIAAVSYLKEMKLCVPPLDVQDKFVSSFIHIDRIKFAIKRQIKNLQELLDKKMDEYFNVE